MADARNLRLAGLLFLLASLVFYFTSNMTMGTVFLVIGAVCLGMVYARKAKAPRDDG